jgi:hypothetical protein
MAKHPKKAIKKAPVASLTTIESVVGSVLTFLVAHGVIGSIDVSATTQTIAPFVALVVPAIFGFAKWQLVSPVDKVNKLVDRDGVVSDADIGRIGALLDDRLAAHGSPAEGADARITGLRQVRGPRGMAAGSGAA